MINRSQCYQQRIEMFHGFLHDVWLSEVGHPTHRIAESATQQSVVNSDDIGPDDVVSHASKPKSTSHKSSSSSRASSTSSAHIKAQMEKAALMEWVASLKKKHEQLKRRKEQQELETWNWQQRDATQCKNQCTCTLI